MGKGSPSMVALLGLLAVAGYQNRDKLSELLRNQGVGGQPRRDGDTSHAMGESSQGGLMDNIRDMVGGTAAGSGIMAGLSDLMDRFSNPRHSAKAQSWVSSGPNTDLEAGDLEEVLDEGTVTDLMQQTGLDRSELMNRLRSILPEAVDRITPHGRMPTEDEFRSI